MVEVTRKQVEERAYQIWKEAGCPEGSSLAHWLQAEVELGVIPKAEASDPIVTLHELAVEDQAAASAEPADAALQQAVDQTVPTSERLPGRADENPLSEHVKHRARAGAATRRHDFRGWRHGEAASKGGAAARPSPL